MISIRLFTGLVSTILAEMQVRGSSRRMRGSLSVNKKSLDIPIYHINNFLYSSLVPF
jgi:hypothetical protein